MQLEGTVALVTGGARRVGRAIALELARAGCDIGIHYHTSHDEAQQLATEIADMGRRVVTIAADLKDATCWSGVIQQTVDNLNRLDILINNAAVFPGGGSDGVDEFRVDLWEFVMRINLIAPMGLSRYARQHLAARGGGKIINLCDISSDRPWTDHLAYCSSKAALVALTKGLARALAPDVQVNGVAAGIAVFPEEYDESLRRRLTDRVPLKRAGSPEDIAQAVRFLVEHGDYMTGEIITVDGGLRLA